MLPFFTKLTPLRWGAPIDQTNIPAPTLFSASYGPVYNVLGFLWSDSHLHLFLLVV